MYDQVLLIEIASQHAKNLLTTYAKLIIIYMIYFDKSIMHYSLQI